MRLTFCFQFITIIIMLNNCFQQVRIRVVDFSTQTEDDMLKMWDSQNNSVAWLYDSPTTAWPDILIPDSHVHIMFTTNGAGQNAGFHLEYMCDTSSGRIISEL